jgi:hypothetical protein
MNGFEVTDEAGFKDEARIEKGVAVVEEKAMKATMAEQRKEDRSMMLRIIKYRDEK